MIFPQSRFFLNLKNGENISIDLFSAASRSCRGAHITQHLLMTYGYFTYKQYKRVKNHGSNGQCVSTFFAAARDVLVSWQMDNKKKNCIFFVIFQEYYYYFEGSETNGPSAIL